MSWLADSQKTALDGIVPLVADNVADMETTGETPPQPLTERHFSGRFNVRTPLDKHCERAIKAAEQNTSLNRLISDRLSNL